MRERLSLREGIGPYSRLIYFWNTTTQEKEKGPTACGKYSHSGKGIEPHSMREILSLRKGSRAPQHAGRTLTQGRK